MKPIMLASIILPTYNEAGNIQELIEEIDRTVRYPKEIIVVDDNSPDGTSGKVASYMKKTHRAHIRLETRKTNRGLTPSIRRGIEIARGDVVVWMDADFSMPPRVINTLVHMLEQSFDVAVGSRFVPGGETKHAKGAKESRAAIVLSALFNRIVPILLGQQFHDYTSGFIAVRREVLRVIPLRGFYGEYFIDLITRAFRQGFRVAEVPYVCLPRRAGTSKTDLLAGRRYISAVLRLMVEKYFHPV